MFRLEIDAADMASSRFAISPLRETLAAVGELAGAHLRADPFARRWLEARRPRFEHLRSRVPMLDVLAALQAGFEFHPRFLCPSSQGTHETAERQLETVRRTPPWQARAELDLHLAQRPHPMAPAMLATLSDPDVDFVAGLATALEAAWHELIRPDWPAIRAILQRDLQYRAGQLVTYGWASTMSGLSPDLLRWRAAGGNHLMEAPTRPHPEYHPPGGGGLLFGPTIFGYTEVSLEPPWHREVFYPPRGSAGLLESTPPQTGADPLAGLVGATRAHILRDLGRPATTTQLTYRHHLSLGAVGHQLSVLSAAGLVAGIRDGQSVIYHRTELGGALVAANTL